MMGLVWDSHKWEQGWRLYESAGFTNGEKVVIGWMMANSKLLKVDHAHLFIANGCHVSRSTVARTMDKLVKMGAARQVGEQKILLKMCQGRHMDVSGVTHNREERDTKYPLSASKESLSKPAPTGAEQRSVKCSEPYMGRCRYCNSDITVVKMSVVVNRAGDMKSVVACEHCRDRSHRIKIREALGLPLTAALP